LQTKGEPSRKYRQTLYRGSAAMTTVKVPVQLQQHLLRAELDVGASKGRQRRRVCGDHQPAVLSLPAPVL